MIRNAIALAAAALLSSACAHPVEVLHQGDASFQQGLKTYAVLYHPVGSSQSTRHIFESAVHDAMAAKGYQQAPPGQAQMFINFKALTTSEAAPTEEGAGSAGIDSLATDSSDAQKVVIVSIENAASDEIMWVGWSTGAYTKDEVLTQTRKAVQAILKLVPAHAPGAPAPPAGGEAAPPAPAGG